MPVLTEVGSPLVSVSPGIYGRDLVSKDSSALLAVRVPIACSHVYDWVSSYACGSSMKQSTVAG